MPADVPPQKMQAVRDIGCEIATFERDSELSDDVVERLRAETGRIIVPPSANPHVLAGAGTVALEVHDQATQLGATLDAVLVPCGGGGLMLFYEPEEEQRMGAVRVEMAKEAGANVIVTACPFCLVNIEDAIKVSGLEGEMEAIDLSELIANHLG